MKIAVLFFVLLIAVSAETSDLPPLPLELVNDYNRSRADQLEARAAVVAADAAMNESIQAIWKFCGGGAKGVELDEKRDPKCKHKEPAK